MNRSADIPDESPANEALEDSKEAILKSIEAGLKEVLEAKKSGRELPRFEDLLEELKNQAMNRNDIHDVSAELEKEFGAVGSPEREEAVNEAWEEYNETTLKALQELKEGKVTRCNTFEEYLEFIKDI